MRVIVLSGSGLSADSGLHTCRGAVDMVGEVAATLDEWRGAAAPGIAHTT